MKQQNYTKILNIVFIILFIVIIIDNIQKRVYIQKLEYSIEQRDSLMYEYFNEVDEMIEYLLSKE